MASWDGWAEAFLASASLPATTNTVAFMEDWAIHADSPGCANNPIDNQRPEAGSTNCGPVREFGRRSQAYVSHAQSRTAFAERIATGDFPHLAEALQSGDPYSVDDWQLVVKNIGDWGSTKFANVYLAQRSAGAGAGVTPARVHGGWADLRHTLNHTMPASLKTTRHSLGAALRELHRASKVKL